MPSIEALVQALSGEYENERTFIDSLPLESRTSHGTPEAWSALDLQGHITAWKHQTVLRLQGDPSAVVEESDEETDQANAVFFDTFAHRTWEDVLGESETTHKALIDELGKLRDDDLARNDRFPWQDDQPLWRRLAGTLLIHPWMHIAEHAIERADIPGAQAQADAMLAHLGPVADVPSWLGALYYNAACIFARAGVVDKAFAHLEPALKQRPDLIEWSKQDPDLVNLGADERMEKLYASLNS